MTINQDFEDQFQDFCEFADALGPARAASKLRRLRVPEETLEQLVERFEHHVGQIKQVTAPGYIQQGSRFTWYTGPRPGDPCWWPLERSLQESSWEAENLKALDESSSLILGLMEHPATSGFRTKGLALGHVQSGKTTNFTAVMAKAADRGYRLFIVLAGIHNELRRQTQSRLQDQLVDLSSEYWHPLTGDEHDFVPPVGAAAYFGRYAQQPVLCVVKKNATILRKLITWLEEAKDQLSSCPAIVIDDEADQAAVATRTINPLILELLDCLPRVNYIGYTATPFANLLIDPASANLYPEDFIVDLPKPKGHYGTEVLFGRAPLDHEDPEDVPTGFNMIREVPVEEVAAVRPASNAAVATFEADVHGQLSKAVLWFTLASAARRARGQGTPHSTMLIHTSVRVAVHQAFRDPLEQMLAGVRNRLQRGDRHLLTELRDLWEEEVAKVPAQLFDLPEVTFDGLLPHLAEILSEVRIVLDNSNSEERLDYSTGPVTAIAVGGNTLSRGLTLEGLVCSYFVRSASAYDTLLQMGRWFGYRGGYADLPRIWMTDELRRWFRHIAGVEAEMRQDIRRYMTEDLDPTTFAVRIQAHPSLRITAAAKMRDAVQVGAAFGGMRVQTHYFEANNRDWLLANKDAADLLVRSISAEYEDRFDGRTERYMWTGVDRELILTFLAGYEFHKTAVESQTGLIAGYIQDRVARDALLDWNVAIVGSAAADRGSYTFTDEISVPRVVRSRIAGTPDAEADIKTLMSRRDAALDLQNVPAGNLSEDSIKNLRRAQLPSTGLLVLYPIDPHSPSDRDGRDPLNAEADVIGVGLVFPQPPADEESKIYFAADLSRVEPEDGYLEDDDLDPLYAN